MNNILSDSTLIIIPARGGSKGIPDKNITKVNGVPLIEYTINFAQKLTNKTNILVSTDSPRIAEVSQAAGATCPFLRPKELSTDLIGDIPVLRHALNSYQDLNGKSYELILMLQPTSPVRYEHQVREAISKLIENNYDSLISISSVPRKFHPLKQFEISRDKLQVFSERAFEIKARQQLNTSYIRNGVLYLFTAKFINSSNYVLSDNTGSIIVEEKWFNIDELNDIEEFENYITNS
jgi:CMP-N,N'-diacetyllegionaminic acid synthase